MSVLFLLNCSRSGVQINKRTHGEEQALTKMALPFTAQTSRSRELWNLTPSPEQRVKWRLIRIKALIAPSCFRPQSAFSMAGTDLGEGELQKTDKASPQHTQTKIIKKSIGILRDVGHLWGEKTTLSSIPVLHFHKSVDSRL